MRSFKKKLTVLFAGALLACSAASLGGCAGYNPAALPGDISGEVTSNGGFVVEKGNYVYFINGSEQSDADNTYGDVVKGALYRIGKTDLKTGKYDQAERVVSSLFVAQNYDGGVFIYGDYVYFASPTTEKEKDGAVSNSWLSFKRAKLDGSSTQKEIDEYLFRLDNNSVSYRFVEKDGVVYCMYVKDSALYSFNTETKATTLLVSGASTYYFDTEDAENGNVYYLMSVPTDVTADASTYQYNQIYCVTPDATAEVNADETSYTVKGYRTYAFDRASIVKKNSDFDASDISQYPYVNLGRLVADGRGSGVAQTKTQYNDTDDVNASKNAGYKYAILAYRSGRLLFTRVDNDPVSDDVPVYTFTEAQRTAATDWKRDQSERKLHDGGGYVRERYGKRRVLRSGRKRARLSVRIQQQYLQNSGERRRFDGRRRHVAFQGGSDHVVENGRHVSLLLRQRLFGKQPVSPELYGRSHEIQSAFTAG